MVARIDERVEVMHEALPALAKVVARHEKDIFMARIMTKILIFGTAVFLAVKYPLIAEAVTRIIP